MKYGWNYYHNVTPTVKCFAFQVIGRCQYYTRMLIFREVHSKSESTIQVRSTSLVLKEDWLDEHSVLPVGMKILRAAKSRTVFLTYLGTVSK